MAFEEKKVEILQDCFSDRFIELMQNSLVQSHYKYGSAKDNYGVHKTVNAFKSIQGRMDMYEKTGNADFLIDIANFAMLEFMYPQHKESHYRFTSSDEAPKLCGISTKQIREMAVNENE